MDLWSFQNLPFYEELRQKGKIHATSEHIDPDNLAAYDWLCEQMRQKIVPAPEGARYPIWAWHSWDWKHKKPDMRLWRFRWKEPTVLLELSIPDDRVLLSDYELWHFVLNDWFLHLSTSEDQWNAKEAWYDALPVDQQRAEKRRSWQRIFDVTPFNGEWMRKGMDIQATFWELTMADVRKVSFHPAKRIAEI